MTLHIPSTRREFIQLALATAAGSAASTYVSPSWAQAAPVTRLKVGLTPPANQVTVGYLAQNSSTGPLQPMYEFLVASDRFTGQMIPQLATDWQTPRDGKEWRFRLRNDVVFHDGAKFTAKDVVFSWQLITSPESRATTAALFRQLIKSADDIKVVNDYEVVFNLSRPELDLPYYLTQGFLIYSKDHWDKVGAAGYARQPIGTGPFKFKEFRAGEYILYERAEKHWRQIPEFKELQMFFMPEDTTRLAALLTGEIHIAEIPRAIQNQALARGKKIATSSRPAVHISGAFGGNYISEKGKPNPGPLTNKLVREAMNLAINRQEINEQIFGGRGEIARVQPYTRDDPASNAAWQNYAYDPARAKALLTQAGYANGFDFDMTVVSPPGFPEIPTVVEAAALYFRAIGLRPKLVQIEQAALIDRQRSSSLQNTVIINRQSMQPLFQAMFYYSTKGVQHFFEDAYLEAQVDKFAQSVSVPERLQIHKDMGEFLYNEHATLPILFLNAEVGIDPTVVAEYKADMGVFGASVSHEYTKAAVK